MYIGSQTYMKYYDEYLLNHGYSIVELVDKASDCLIKHINGKNISLLCGVGNNGADGLSLAIKLKQQGVQVHVFIFSEEGTSEANRYYLDECDAHQVDVRCIKEDDISDIVDIFHQCDVIVDAMFGFGLHSSPRGLYQLIIEEVNQLVDQDIIAVDIPTGLDCNTGHPYQSVIYATQTITLSAIKNGFLNPDSEMFTGHVILEALDVEDIFDKVGMYQLADDQIVEPMLKERQFDGHKGTYGHVGLITGCLTYKGASLLSAKASVYSGSGITTVLTEQEVIDSLTVFCPEATTSQRPAAFSEDDFQKYNALLIGCGLGQNIDAYRYVVDVLTSSKQNVVIDADALTILSSNLNLLENQEREIVLTPHMGEFKRLCEFNDDDDLLFIAKQFAKRHHITLVLKGPYTIVTNGEEAYRVAAGDKAMASGGMGDVLAGIITSLLGQGYSAIQASLLGVYIHGKAGESLAKTSYTVIPSQLIEEIPLVMKTIIEKNHHLDDFR